MKNIIKLQGQLFTADLNQLRYQKNMTNNRWRDIKNTVNNYITKHMEPIKVVERDDFKQLLKTSDPAHTPAGQQLCFNCTVHVAKVWQTHCTMLHILAKSSTSYCQHARKYTSIISHTPNQAGRQSPHTLAPFFVFLRAIAVNQRRSLLLSMILAVVGLNSP